LFIYAVVVAVGVLPERLVVVGAGVVVVKVDR
jgi:hypothetical protein